MLKDVIEILSDMIRIDSRNTMPLEAEGERVATEEEMGLYVEGLMRTLGMEVEKQYIAPKRPNVIGFHGANGFVTLPYPAFIHSGFSICLKGVRMV